MISKAIVALIAVVHIAAGAHVVILERQHPAGIGDAGTPAHVASGTLTLSYSHRTC